LHQFIEYLILDEYLGRNQRKYMSYLIIFSKNSLFLFYFYFILFLFYFYFILFLFYFILILFLFYFYFTYAKYKYPILIFFLKKISVQKFRI